MLKIVFVIFASVLRAIVLKLSGEYQEMVKNLRLKAQDFTHAGLEKAPLLLPCRAAISLSTEYFGRWRNL